MFSPVPAATLVVTSGLNPCVSVMVLSYSKCLQPVWCLIQKSFEDTYYEIPHCC